MSDYDRHLAGYDKYPVRVKCKCGNEWDDVLESEYGTSWLTTHEECPKCGAGGEELTTDLLDSTDIEERKLEARGEDF
jgi:hypothetical protein